MAFQSLSNINNSISRAVGATAGLNSFFMIDESEINQLATLKYPICVIEPPNSSLFSMHRAYENYEMSCFILLEYDNNRTNKGEVLAYDSALQLFEGFITNLAEQRNGYLIVDKDNFEIERIKNYGSAKSIGVKVEFNLLAPSHFGNFTERSRETEDIVFPLTTNLTALFHGAHNVTRTNSSLAWSSVLHGSDGQKTISHFNSSDVAEYSSPTFTFSGAGAEGMVLDGLDFSSANFCIAFKLSIDAAGTSDHNVIFEMYEPSSGDAIRLSSQSGASTEGRPFIQIDEDNDGNDEIQTSSNIFFNEDISQLDINPLNECSFAFVNNATLNDMYIKILPNTSTTVETHKISGQSHGNQFLNAKMYIGFTDLRPYNFGFRPLQGTISHIAIYDSALTSADVNEVLLDIKEL
jgi:hypothetical protein